MTGGMSEMLDRVTMCGRSGLRNLCFLHKGALDEWGEEGHSSRRFLGNFGTSGWASAIVS